MWNKPPVYGFLFQDNSNFSSRLSFSNIIYFMRTGSHQIIYLGEFQKSLKSH